MAAALRSEFRGDRQFLVGTTDFDLAIGRVWDMAREMDTTTAGLSRGREILFASTAIPGIFPPTLLDGHVHSDGGVIANLLVPLDLASIRGLALRLRAYGIAESVTVRVWTVVNLFTHMSPTVVNPSDRGAMSMRASLLLLAAQQQQTL